MAATYAHEAKSLAKFAARQAPVDLDGEDAPHPRRRRRNPGAVVARARARALDLSAFVQYPEQVLPVPFFSELPQEPVRDRDPARFASSAPATATS